MNKTKIAILGIVALFAVLAVSTATAHVTLYLDPQHSSVPDGFGYTTEVKVMANVTGADTLRGGQFNIEYDTSCCNVTDLEWGSGIFSGFSVWNPIGLPECHPPGREHIRAYFMSVQSDVVAEICTLTFYCNSTEYCQTDVTFPCPPSGPCITEVMNEDNDNLYPDNATLVNGTFECGTPAETYTISGTVPGVDTVNITNMNTSEEHVADVVGDDYTLTLNVPGEVEAGNKLLIVACEDLGDYESNCNVTTHTVVTAPGEETVDLTLNHYCLNWKTYPYKTWEKSDWSGPAVMQMMVDHYRPEEPTQSDLNDTGIAHNQGCNSDLLQVDPAGMRWTLNNILHNTSSYGGGPFANYGIGSYDTAEKALWYTCYWHYLGPGAAPAYGNYSNWMAIRGIHTSENPERKAQGSYDIHGFWINDPYNETIEGPGGIGENTYKTVNQWVDTYYANLTDVRDGDSYQDKYVALGEPPEPGAVTVTLVASPARFNSTDPVKAAIEGANEQLAPYDAEFAAIFANTIATEPLYVTSDAGDDYYLVPFSSTGSTSDVNVVVIVDGEDGHFKEASWVEEPMEYLPVSEQDAIEIVGESGATAELVHQGSSPYYPAWKVTVGCDVYFVGQDGRLSYGDSVDFKQNVLMAQRALDKPNNEGALMRRNARIAIELEKTIPKCTKVSVWVRKVAWRAPSFEVAVSSDDENWTVIGDATCYSWQWQRFDFTNDCGDWDDVKYIDIRKPGTIRKPKLMGLDAVRAVGRCC